MRCFQYLEPELDENGQDIGPRVMTVSESEIIAGYYLHWCQKMRAAGKESLISREACIEDFVVTHWATEVHLHGSHN